MSDPFLSTTQHNAAMVEQTSAAAVHMREQAEQLNKLLASFRLGDEKAQKPAASINPVRNRQGNTGAAINRTQEIAPLAV